MNKLMKRFSYTEPLPKRNSMKKELEIYRNILEKREKRSVNYGFVALVGVLGLMLLVVNLKGENSLEASMRQYSR